MREIIVDKGKKREISIIETEKYYTFKNICGNEHHAGHSVFATDEIRDDIDDATRRLIIKSKWIENKILVELDDDGNPMTSVDGMDTQKPLLEEGLIKLMKAHKQDGSISSKLEKYLKELTVQQKHVLGIMKKLCVEHSLPTNSFLALQTKEKDFEDIEMGIVK